MRKYHSTRPAAEKSKKHLGRKGVGAIAISASVVLVALALTLSLTFGLRKPADVPDDNDVQQVVTPPPATEQPLTFVAPLGVCNVTKHAALDRLVYNDTLKQWRTHNGVDFEAAAGSEVLAVAPGTVQKVENTILEGVVITVTHAQGYTTVYKGLESASVAQGDSVDAGATIGKVGNMMCEQNAGAHLHLEMQKDGKYVAATDYIEVGESK